MTMKVYSDGTEVAKLTNNLVLQESREPEFLLLWNELLEEGITTFAPASSIADEDDSDGDIVTGDSIVAVAPSKDSVGLVKDYLASNGYVLLKVA
jgi:hypothetical protein